MDKIEEVKSPEIGDVVEVSSNPLPEQTAPKKGGESRRCPHKARQSAANITD